MSAAIRLEQLAISFGAFQAVQPTDLTIERGEFFSFLGPSGCGKTTLLRSISGFTAPSSGQIWIGDKNMTGVPPNKRPTALIFQNLALFPTMTVAENIGYGLRVRGVARKERRVVVERLLEQVALGNLAEKRVTQLSGGQRQRVAIARALAVEPSVLLLDEPLSALDLKLRQHMRTELRAIQKRVGVTFVYITHDQGEALTMSDRVAVMNKGSIEQVGTATEIYGNPKSAFVASFVGTNNALPCIVHDSSDETVQVHSPVGQVAARSPVALPQGARARLFIRPEHLTLNPSSGHCTFQARIETVEFEGALTNVSLRLPDDVLIIATVSGTEAVDIGRGGNPVVPVGFLPRHAVVLPG